MRIRTVSIERTLIIMTIITIIIINHTVSIIGDAQEQVTHELISNAFNKRGNAERMREKKARERERLFVAL